MKKIFSALFVAVLFDAGTGLPIQNLDYPCSNRTPDARYICEEIDPLSTVQSSTSTAMLPVLGQLETGTITASPNGSTLITPEGPILAVPAQQEAQ